MASRFTDESKVLEFLARAETHTLPAAAAAPTTTIGASYDAAQTNRHNQNHWANADSLSPNASNTPSVRHALRTRSRYETSNNPMLKGIVRTLSNHTIGRGPRIEFLMDDATLQKKLKGRIIARLNAARLNAKLQQLWTSWVKHSGLQQKLWTMKHTQVVDGECFLLQIGNPKLKSKVKLDYQVLEADYVTSLRPQWTPWQVDGITYDPQWNPTSYQVVTQRPNDVLPIVWPQQHKVDASQIIHYFIKERPGQGRGVPLLLSAFEFLAVCRRYIGATVSAAEVAASYAAFIKTVGPAVTQTEGTGARADDWLTLEIQKNLITMLPEGMSIEQLKPEQPTQSFREFVETMIKLLVRCISMPLNIALCDSSGYSFSSSRMDHMTYFDSINVDRTWIDDIVMVRILADFLAEAELILQLPKGTLNEIAHEWHWPRPISVDPSKENEANRGAVESGQISIVDAQKRGGVGGDIIRENAEYFGVSEDEMRKAQFAKLFGPNAGAPAPTPPKSEEESPTPAPKPSGAKAKARLTAQNASLSCAADLDLHCTSGPANVEITAAAGDTADAVPKFKMTAYTGGAMHIPDHEYPVIIELASAYVVSQQTPILYEHDSEREVGHADKVLIDATGIYVPQGEGFFSGANEWRDKVVNGAKRKFPWQASVGGRAGRIETFEEGETFEVNGQSFEGPAEVAIGFGLREISVLSLGGDAATKTELAARAAQAGANDMPGFEEFVKSLGFDPASLSEAQKQNLMNLFQAQQTEAEASADDEEAEGSEDDGEEQTEAEDDDENTEAEEDDEEDGKGKTTARAGTATLTRTSAKRQKVRAKNGKGSRTVNASQSAANRRQEIRAMHAKELRRVERIRAKCGDNHQLAAKAIEKGWTMDKIDLHVLRNQRHQGVYGGPLAAGHGGPDQGAVIECSMLLRGGKVKEDGLKKLDPRYSDDVVSAACEKNNRYYSFTRLTHEYLAARGKWAQAGGLTEEGIRAALHQSQLDIHAEDSGFSTISLPGILSNLLNKSLLASYLAVPTVSQKFCGTQDLNDFKVATRYRLTMAGTLQKIGAQGELKNTTLSEEKWSNQLDTYGTVMTLDRQTMINDDLDAFTALPRQLGRQTALTIEELVFTLLLANAAGAAPDTNNFFSAAHNNYQTGAGSALGITGLTAAVTGFLKQTDNAGKPVVLLPRYLLVPPELLPLAEQLYKNQNLVAFNVSTSGSSKLVPAENPFQNKYEPISSPYLSNQIISGYSTTGWYLLADPADVPMLSIGYLRGQRQPTIDQGQTDFDILGFRWRCYFDVGVGAVDWRAGVLNAGA